MWSPLEASICFHEVSWCGLTEQTYKTWERKISRLDKKARMPQIVDPNLSINEFSPISIESFVIFTHQRCKTYKDEFFNEDLRIASSSLNNELARWTGLCLYHVVEFHIKNLRIETLFWRSYTSHLITSIKKQLTSFKDVFKIINIID